MRAAKGQGLRAQVTAKPVGQALGPSPPAGKGLPLGSSSALHRFSHLVLPTRGYHPPFTDAQRRVSLVSSSPRISWLSK